MSGPALGVCYYPEQWDESLWAEDAARMVALGLTWVRIAEFAWARIEPAPGRFDWGWLDRAVEVLGSAGLKVILCTPTAAPPKWLVDLHPDILPVAADGTVRKFGARRHYCFSSPRYREEAARITRAVAERYGRNPHVQAWQTDNEYGDHDTVHSYSPAALAAFRDWLRARYGTIGALNRAWGTSFWSMAYSDFGQIELPNNLVEEPSPTHRVDFLRFSSDQVRSFNRAQVGIIRRLSPGRPVTHNYMNQNTDFDHFAVGEDLDLASWDVYPLGGLVHGRLPEAMKARYLRTGDPDQTAFNHDLYRAVGRGRVWVMEQQPGPVNWAVANPAPRDGMVRLWTWLAFAHGCEMVSYFRWRQAPFAQEQYHTGLLHPDSTPDQAFHEVAAVVAEAQALPPLPPRAQARVALVLDYPSRWAGQALPQGQGCNPAHVALDWYAAARRHGVEVDIIGQHSDPEGYDLILAPDLIMADAGFLGRVKAAGAKILFGPRSGSKTAEMQTPEGLAPGPLRAMLDMRVSRVESLPGYHAETVMLGNLALPAHRWRETVETREEVLATFAGDHRGGSPALLGNDRARYLAALMPPEGLLPVITGALDWAGVAWQPDLGDIRLTRRGEVTFAFNYGPDPATAPAPAGARFLIGGRVLPPAGVAAWEGSERAGPEAR
ncbi:beta-galactosidase [Albidovulum sediminis]|uniref:Beta-galactosidase n=1 Tax=Albidovulum sediminis TaxID=3066345 RepID=A0ABT2NKF5_9RHOB|nr:beta-galactosidase [Defluviimonas sediminis]MCT8329406.1 beta-galactosidase [Defluviimonas sediminis]